MLNKKLELLALAKDFKVEERENNYGYVVESKDDNLKAYLHKNDITYVAYDSCDGFEIEIDMESLEKLKKFCEFLIE